MQYEYYRESEIGNEASSGRMRWTDEMKAVFHEAVQHYTAYDLGDPTPQKILSYMKEAAKKRSVGDPSSFERLTRTHVSSHLQKYRQKHKTKEGSVVRTDEFWKAKEMRRQWFLPGHQKYIDDTINHLKQQGLDDDTLYYRFIDLSHQVLQENMQPPLLQKPSKQQFLEYSLELKNQPDPSHGISSLQHALVKIIELLSISKNPVHRQYRDRLVYLLQSLPQADRSNVSQSVVNTIATPVKWNRSNSVIKQEKKNSLEHVDALSLSQDLMTVVFPREGEELPEYLSKLSSQSLAVMLKGLSANVSQVAEKLINN